jgi:MoxR-like ATPase
VKKSLSLHATQPLPLPPSSFGARAHLFEPDDVAAVEAAVAARRPLLLRGEPGVGKTQLAEAVAVFWGIPRHRHAVDARTEARDFLYDIDFIARLNEAQMAAFDGDSPKSRRERLKIENYIRRGVLWEAFDPRPSAPSGKMVRDSKRSPKSSSLAPVSCVVLIDEIDKAESDVPNGLLTALGDLSFEGPCRETIRCQGKLPLIVVTTNEERELPDAFMRRCIVHTMTLPADPSDFFVRRGLAVFSHFSETLIREAAAMLCEDRRDAASAGERKPGLAEFLDLLRVIDEPIVDDSGNARPRTADERANLLSRVRKFIFKKFSGGRRS